MITEAEGIITDRDHLNQVVQRLMRDVVDVAEAWLREDADACAPASRDGLAARTSGGLPGDPTAGMADSEGRYRERDWIGRQLVRLRADTATAVARYRTRSG